MSYSLPLPDIAATEELAARLAPHLRRRDILALEGSLGAGKTTFARALLHRLGIASEIPSPTFTLVQFYNAKNLPIYHFDLYRLKNESELDELGWDDACADGLVIIEWPEKGAGRMPGDRLCLRFDMKDGMRNCTVTAKGQWLDRLKDIA